MRTLLKYVRRVVTPRVMIHVNPLTNGDRMTRDELLDRISCKMGQYPGQRYGQKVFNSMWEIAPDVAESLAGTEYDPFYHDERVDMFIDECLNHL